MMSDAISHVVLLGIVLSYFVTRDITSPFLILGATLTGLVTVVLVELLNKTRLVKEDAAIGLVFPFLFSIAVILIARYAGDVHLDTDAVLLGELAFAPFNRVELAGIDLGPKALVVMAIILAVSIAFVTIFFKELKLATFDASLASALGFAPVAIHYALMGLVSVTAVGAFDAVGSILVVALMIAPPAAAYLMTDNLSKMIVLSCVFGIVSAVSGYWLAVLLDANIAGSMATTAGLLFFLVLLAAPERGLVSAARRRAGQKQEFAQTMLTIHLLHHENRPEAEAESRTASLHEHLRWDPQFAQQVVVNAERQGLVTRRGPFLLLTDDGRGRAQREMSQ